MKLLPVLLDARPRYLGVSATDASLLQLPVGHGLLVHELIKSAQRVSTHPPVVIPSFASDAAYEERVRTIAPIIDSVTTPAAFRRGLTKYDPSDLLLLISPSLFPETGFDLRPLLTSATREGPMVRHLLAFESSPLGTKEFVHSEDGRVRRIQRYFEPVTWPFAAGVVASLVPIASLITTSELPRLPLDQLRRALSLGGIPSQDVASPGKCFDLSDETGALALNEYRVVNSRGDRDAEFARSRPARPRYAVHPTARLLGPVIIQEGVVVEEGALIVGPTVLGARARIKSDAVVAHCLVLPGASVAEGATVRQRAVILRSPREKSADSDSQRRHSPAVGLPALEKPADVSRLYPIVKAAIEPIIAGATLLAISPLLIVIAAAVKLSSKGPIFYGDLREGKKGKLFRCWKFRTMKVNAAALQHTLAAKQQMDGPQFKMDKDPRVTRLGSFLRRTSLDELPQLLNVVLGDMSCIGPRPSPFNENQICVPWRNARLSVRPGISGLWQVCRFNRSEGDFHQWISYDLLYVNNVSLQTDLRIVLATFKTLLGLDPVKAEDITGVPASYTAGSPSVGEGRAWSQAFQNRAESARETGTPASSDPSEEKEVLVDRVALADVVTNPAEKPPVTIPAGWPGLPIFTEHQAATESAS